MVCRARHRREARGAYALPSCARQRRSASCWRSRLRHLSSCWHGRPAASCAPRSRRFVPRGAAAKASRTPFQPLVHMVQPRAKATSPWSMMPKSKGERMNAVESARVPTVVAREVREKSFSAGREQAARSSTLRGVHGLRVEPGRDGRHRGGPAARGKSTLLALPVGGWNRPTPAPQVMGRQVVRASRTARCSRRAQTTWASSSSRTPRALAEARGERVAARAPCGPSAHDGADGPPCSRAWGWKDARRAGPRICRAASSSAWPSPARSRAGPT